MAIVPQDAPPLFDVLAFDFVLAGRYARLPRWRPAHRLFQGQASHAGARDVQIPAPRSIMACAKSPA